LDALAIGASIESLGDRDDDPRNAQERHQSAQDGAHGARSNRHYHDLGAAQSLSCIAGRIDSDALGNRNAQSRVLAARAQHLHDRIIALGAPQANVVPVVDEGRDQGGAHIARAENRDPCHGDSMTAQNETEVLTRRGRWASPPGPGSN
jgi:hypothetical protein